MGYCNKNFISFITFLLYNRDMENQEPHKKPGFGSVVLRHVAGMGIATAIGGALGAGYAAIKGGGYKKFSNVGAVVGFMSSLGFGKMVYDTFFDRGEIKRENEEMMSTIKKLTHTNPEEQAPANSTTWVDKHAARQAAASQNQQASR